MSIKELDPQIVWKNFYALTQIPRPSKHEELAVEYMYNWGKEHGLETIKDEVGNIIIRKPATPGCENMKGVILQGHVDMVPQKNADTVHDFEKDGLKLRVEDGFIKATGTSGSVMAGAFCFSRRSAASGWEKSAHRLPKNRLQNSRRKMSATTIQISFGVS